MSVYVQTNQPIQLALNQAAYAVSAADTGKIFLVGVQGQALTITLTALAAGLHYRFQTTVGGAALAALVRIRGVGGANIYGTLAIVGATPVYIKAQTHVQFVSAATPCAIGDFVELYCDGVQWSAFGSSGLAGGMSIAP